MFYYSDVSIWIYKVLSILCYVQLGLGWLSAILGMFMRRLAGLEAIWVLQVSYLPFMWLNGYVLRVFDGMAVLRYSGGYNINILN